MRACYHKPILNPFPELLAFGFLAPFILRLLAGLIFIDLGVLKLRSERQRWIASFDTVSRMILIPF